VRHCVLSVLHFEINCKAVYPTLPCSSLNDGTFQSLCLFSFCDGARFIHDDSFSTELLVSLIHLVAMSSALWVDGWLGTVGWFYLRY
jgi:hypothetical protein